MSTKNLLKGENLGLFLLSLLLFSQLHFAWWVYPVLILAPDLGRDRRHLCSPRVGSFTYNLTHHKGLASLLYIAGMLYSADGLALAGVIMIGHSSIDRVFGYGLKFSDSIPAHAPRMDRPPESGQNPGAVTCSEPKGDVGGHNISPAFPGRSCWAPDRVIGDAAGCEVPATFHASWLRAIPANPSASGQFSAPPGPYAAGIANVSLKGGYHAKADRLVPRHGN